MKLANRTHVSKLGLLLTLSISLFFTSAQAQTTPRDAVVDFNGDGKTDYSIIRSAGFGSQFTWWNLESGTGNVTSMPLGLRAIDQPVPADYDGDGKDDIAMFRFNGPEAGTWYIWQSSTNSLRIDSFGRAGDNPTVVDDFDGDGTDDLAVFRINTAGQGPGQAYFYYRGSLNNPEGKMTAVPWGMRYGSQSEQADDPYTGDFDGDGKADFSVQRHADGVGSTNGPAIFITLLSSTGDVTYNYFQNKSDRVLPGDYDGDGRTDLCVARGFNVSPGNTTWFIRYSSGIPDYSTVFGAGFSFAQGDYDGDGKTDVGYFMTPADPNAVGFWYQSSANNQEARFVRWGSRPTGPTSPGAGDLPAAGYNNR